MKKLGVLILFAGMAWLHPVQAQPNDTKLQPVPPPAPKAQPEKLTRFDLDFGGGRPAELVKAIERATSKHLNVIIPDEYAQKEIPALKMKGVTVPQLFQALSLVTHKQVVYKTDRFINGMGPGSSFTGTVEYGFRTFGTPSEDSIWYFYYEAPTGSPDADGHEPKPICRFFQLGPYLENCTIDDITTAIETGWKMLGETAPPRLSFHKETNLLIAVGDSEGLMLIDRVLESLPRKPVHSTAQPKSGEVEKH